jgi:adenine/guanine/hypoxanthine permease
MALSSGCALRAFRLALLCECFLMRKWKVVRGDMDGFFGLFLDNLLQLLLIATLCPLVCGFSVEFVSSRILPGAAVSILVGNLFYAWQARQLMKKTGRNDVTALPYGINTVSLIAFIFLIMGPIYRETGRADLAWQAGLGACFFSALMEMAGALVGHKLRCWTPRAAMLSALAGIAITFISMGFVFQIFASPAIALIPMLLILIFYASRTKLPLGIPAGMVAVLVGVALAWVLRGLGMGGFTPERGAVELGFYPPQFALGELYQFIVEGSGWKYFSIIVPMGLFNVIGSLQCLESAAAAGDDYATAPSLLVNGLGSLVAASLGSAFATTIYIGHPGWKAMGARSSYSTINGLVILLLCLGGGLSLVMQVLPLEATLGILLWIGLMMMAQTIQETPRSHALAVAMGLLPSLAAWALLLIETTLRVAGMSLVDAVPKFGTQLYLEGVIALSQGFLISSMLLSAILVFVIEGKRLLAAVWLLVAAVLSSLGLIHAYELTALGVENRFGFGEAPAFTWSYLAMGLFLMSWHFWEKRAAKVSIQDGSA